MSSHSNVPTFIVVGPQKAGTSWLYEYFIARGDICLPQGVKETFFFDDRFTKKNLDWYSSHFQLDPSGHRVIAEVAPTYFHSEAACQRIVQLCGEIPILVTLRDPVLRSESLYKHLVRYGFTSDPLREAVSKHPVILDSSRYAKHLQNWRNAFGTERVQVLTQEELASDPASYVSKTCKFLDLPSAEVNFDFSKKVNESVTSRSALVARWIRLVGDWLRDRRLYGPINYAKHLGLKSLIYGSSAVKTSSMVSEADRKWLREQLAGETERVEELLGIDLSVWSPK